MSYETRLKLKELDEKYKSTFRSSLKEMENDLEKQRLILIGYCLNALNAEKTDFYNLTLSKILDKITSQVNMYIMLTDEIFKKSKEKEFEEAETDKDGNKLLYFCGWNYSNKNNSLTVASISKSLIEKLFLISIDSISKRYSTNKEEQEIYYDKLDELSQTFNEYDDMIYDILNEDFFYENKSSEDVFVEEDE